MFTSNAGERPGPDRPLPVGVAIAWGLQPPPTRGPRPGLTIEKIVAAAIEVADEGGLAGVSMNKVAERLGFTTMSLYRYVTAKDDLVMLMGDAALGPPPVLGGGKQTWRDAVEVWARAMLVIYRGHPWILDVPITGPPAMPNQLAWLDALLQRLAPTALTYDEQLSIALLVDGYARSWATLSKSVRDASEDAERRIVAPEALRSLVDHRRFPALAPMIAAGEFENDTDLEDTFSFNLERIIDGIDTLVRKRKAALRKSRGPKV